jgi:hypothetical protein|tara:strand:- start:560 stop:1018 length:459 start_codon:yes stop_codon:yes gene_type:complete
MATLNSNEITRVYGSTTSIDATTERTGDYAFAVDGGVQVASFSFTSTAAGSGGDVINLTCLPLNAVVVGIAVQPESGFGGHASAAITLKVDSVTVGSALTINTSSSSVTNGYFSGNGLKVSGAGLVTMTQNAQAFAGDKLVEGQVFYFVDGK